MDVQTGAGNSEGVRESERHNDPAGSEGGAGRQAIGDSKRVEDGERTVQSAQLVFKGVGSDPVQPVTDNETTREEEGGSTDVLAVEEQEGPAVVDQKEGEGGGGGASGGSEQLQGDEAVSKGDLATKDRVVSEALGGKELDTSDEDKEGTQL